MKRSVYCSFSAFEKILNTQEPYSDIKELILKHHTIFLDLSDEEFNQTQCVVGSRLYVFMRNNPNIKVMTREAFQKNARFHVAKGASSALIILESYDAKYVTDFKKFGVCVITLQDPNSINNLLTHFYWQMEKDRKESSIVNGVQLVGWRSVLAQSQPRLPINALVIIDKFMLKADLNGGRLVVRDACIKNLNHMLQGLMPVDMDKALPFQILLVSTINSKDADSLTYDMLEEINKTLLISIKAFYRYPIEMDIVIIKAENKSAFHRRAIISNYHFLRMDHGVHQFEHGGNKDKEGKSLQHNDISIEGAFRTVNQPNSHMPLQSMWLELNSLGEYLTQSGVLRASSQNNRLLEMVPQPPKKPVGHPYQASLPPR